MKIRKRWISLCLAIILLAGIAFNPGSIAGNYVEAANLEETGEAVSEENTQTDNTAAVLSETDTASAQTESTETVMTETPAEDTTATETPVEETQIETPVETPAPETTETSTPAAPAENVETTTDTEQAVTEQPTTTVPEAPIENTDENTTQEIPAELKSLSFENDEVIITVSEMTAGAIPEGATLKVVPILADNKETEAQYKEVEKQLQDKAAEKASEVVDFLAYDISFVDVNGNEVEPNSEVKVSMEYKNPVLPETDNTAEAGDLEVSVLHLEEDEYGNVKEVVDMGEANKIETLELGTEQQVKKVELTTDSFSVYTITYEQNTLLIKIVNANGIEIGNETYRAQGFNWEREAEVTVEQILNDIKRRCSAVKNEEFNKAVIGEDGKFSYTAEEINSFKFKNSQGYREFRYNPEGADPGKWNSIENGDVVYFIFGDEPELTFRPIKTVSTRDTIDINLFDYQVGSDGDENADWENNSGINAGHALKFVDTKGRDNHTINIEQDGGSGKINSGMVKNQLSNGYPVLSESKQGSNGEPLSYLFDSSTQSNVKSVYSNLDLLFKLDEDGYHVFNSDENYAYLKNDGSGFAEDFTVGNISSQNKGFYPFSQPTSSTISDIKNSSDDAKLGSTGVNHYYGMTIETSFIQPKGGKINNQNMIFEFSGDDDVWVFIDDVLVLDLGGIHGKVSGTINFATGKVTRTDINGVPAAGTTIKEAFEAASVAADFEPETNTFSDYSTHTIKFFYLERGNFDSNCMIKFNFPTIPKDSVAVAKEVTNNVGEGLDYADDIDFEFNIKVGGDNYANQQYSLWENGEQVLDESGNPVTGTTNENGNFTLKHNQMAVFSGIDAGSNYEVTELGAYLDGYEVTVGNTVIDVEKNQIDGETIYSATTEDRVVGEDLSVVFKNAIDKTAKLNIRKVLAVGEENTDKPFQIQVKIQGELYNGTYSVGNQGGLTATNGIIQLEAGQTATITGLPYGVSFEVEEQLDGSYQPTYEIAGNVVNSIIPDYSSEDNAVKSASAQIVGETADVTVINRKLEQEAGTTKVTVEKSWDEYGTYELPPYITVTLYEDVNRNGELDSADNQVSGVSSIQLDEENGWKGEWTNLPGDTDFVVKEEYPEGYQLKTTESVNDITEVVYIDRVETCSDLIWNLQKNNMLVTKKGHDWLIWTLYDLNLTEDEKKEVVKWIAPEVSGNMKYENTDFAFGEGGFGSNLDIDLVDIGNGNWQLQFGHSSTWSMFWYFKYDRTQAITLTNEIIKDHKTSVNVEKVWSDNNPSNLTVEIQLLQNGEPYIENGKEVKIVLKGISDDWKHTFNDLPYFSNVDGKYIVNKYTVIETKIGDTEVVDNYANGYTSSISGSMEEGYIITNSRITPWQIVKVSSSNPDYTLKGAEFELSDNDEVYKGISQEDNEATTDVNESGYIQWFTEAGDLIDETQIPVGTYILKETKAPIGYALSNNTWQVVIKENGAPEISLIVDGSVTSQKLEAENIGTSNNPIYQFEITNTPLYSLPSSGGFGIYWYTIGGMLLMMAGSLILYKNKRREVLERK